MAINLNGTSQRGQLSANFSMFNNSASYTIAIRVKPDTSVTTERFIAGGYHNGGLTRYSGFVYRGNQTPKVYAKVKSTSAQYRPSTPAAAFQASGGWDLMIASRTGTGGAAVPSRQMVNSNTVNTETTEENGSTDLVLFGIGARRDSTGAYFDYFSGKIYDFCCWNVVLDTTQEAALKAGAKLNTIATGNIVDYIEFYGNTAPATITTQAARTLNLIGSPLLDYDSPYKSITSINSGAGVRIGSTGNIAETTGFSSAPEAVSIGSLTGTVTAFDSGTGDTTFTVPSPTHEALYPDVDSTQTVTLSNVGENASLSSVPFTAPVGSTVITVASPINDDPQYLGYWMLDIFGVTPVNGDKFYGIDADVTWAADTGGSAVSLPVTTPVVYWDASTGIAYLLDVTVNPDGIVTNGITARAITAVGMTATGLTARPM